MSQQALNALNADGADGDEDQQPVTSPIDRQTFSFETADFSTAGREQSKGALKRHSSLMRAKFGLEALAMKAKVHSFPADLNHPILKTQTHPINVTHPQGLGSNRPRSGLRRWRPGPCRDDIHG